MLEFGYVDEHISRSTSRKIGFSSHCPKLKVNASSMRPEIQSETSPASKRSGGKVRTYGSPMHCAFAISIRVYFSTIGRRCWLPRLFIEQDLRFKFRNSMRE